MLPTVEEPRWGGVFRREFLASAASATAAIAATGCAAATPVASPPSGAVSQGAAWEREWEALVAAAKQEGTAVVVTITGLGQRQGIQAFEQAFPGITVEHAPFPSVNIWGPKALQERQAGIYSSDVVVGFGTTGNLGTYKAAGMFDPIRPAIFRPDVVDDKAWLGGFDAGFVDLEKKWTFSHGFKKGGGTWINTDLVKEGEVRTLKDMLQPRWRGKMAFMDPRNSGYSYWPATAMRLAVGNESMKALFVDQQPAIVRDVRQITEWLVRGQYAMTIGTGTSYAQLADFKAEGLGKNVKWVEVPELTYLGGTHLYLLNRAPHPSAAKLFINWLLTKQGQETYYKAINDNSRRLDVPPIDPEVHPQPGDEKKYIQIDLEQMLPKVTETQEIAKQLLG